METLHRGANHCACTASVTENQAALWVSTENRGLAKQALLLAELRPWALRERAQVGWTTDETPIRKPHLPI